MSGLSHFLRYQITGLMFFVHLNAFLYGISKICISEQLPKLIAREVFIAVLVGWIIYQIYDTLNPEAHCMKKSIQKVKKWAENGINDTDAKHAIQIGLYNNIKQTKEKKDSEITAKHAIQISLLIQYQKDERKKYSDLNMKELLNLLSSKFDHWGSRIINTVINIFAFLGYFYFLISKNSTFFLITTTFSLLITLYLFSKIPSNKKEIQSYEEMLINLKKDEIMEFLKLIQKK